MRHVSPVTPIRICATCGIEKPIQEYRPWTTESGDIAYASSCLVCSKDRSRLNAIKYGRINSQQISAKNKERYQQPEVRDRAISKSRSYYQNNREKCLAQNKLYAKKNRVAVKVRARKSYLKRAYGLTEEDYLHLLEQQGGRCAICHSTEPGGSKGLFHIDHCHKTGNVRGILCGHCNKGLGLFRDEIDLLLNAASYLSRSQNQEENT